MNRVGKILWASSNKENPIPYLCVDAFEDAGNFCCVLLDIEKGERLTLFVTDIDNLVTNGMVRWES